MLLGWLLRLLLAVLVIRLMWHFVAGVFAGARPKPAERSVALVRDPVCGTYIEPARALSSRAGSTTHYFCSERCQQAFLETA